MSTLVAQTISNGTVSTSSANVIQGSAKAWVNFNGVPTAAIRASYNVSSITRTGTGIYTINFTNAFADTNYALVGTTARDGSDFVYSLAGKPVSTSSATVATNGSSGGVLYANIFTDWEFNSVAVFR